MRAGVFTRKAHLQARRPLRPAAAVGAYTCTAQRVSASMPHASRDQTLQRCICKAPCVHKWNSVDAQGEYLARAMCGPRCVDDGFMLRGPCGLCFSDTAWVKRMEYHANVPKCRTRSRNRPLALFRSVHPQTCKDTRFTAPFASETP